MDPRLHYNILIKDKLEYLLTNNSAYGSLNAYELHITNPNIL